eukprot:GHVL01008624.1.p1 GENE.GHVL01008624.1~~GHVL01008624.1.p1  ORF type:complete len:605 (-),score=75.56 GHVL01008624.1:460-2274(-)
MVETCQNSQIYPTLNLPSNLVNQTLFILDWDDTVFPSTTLGQYVHKHTWQLTNANPELFNQVQELDLRASELLKYLSTFGTAVFVTNATVGWIDDSSRRFMPLTLSACKTMNIKKVYAGTEFARVSVEQRKKLAFETVINDFQASSDCVKNVISVGDAIFEIDALHYCRHNFSNVVGKTVAFAKTPSVEIISKELYHLGMIMRWLIPHAGHLDVDIHNHIDDTDVPSLMMQQLETANLIIDAPMENDEKCVSGLSDSYPPIGYQSTINENRENLVVEAQSASDDAFKPSEQISVNKNSEKFVHLDAKLIKNETELCQRLDKPVNDSIPIDSLFQEQRESQREAGGLNVTPNKSCEDSKQFVNTNKSLTSSSSAKDSDTKYFSPFTSHVDEANMFAHSMQPAGRENMSCLYSTTAHSLREKNSLRFDNSSNDMIGGHDGDARIERTYIVQYSAGPESSRCLNDGHPDFGCVTTPETNSDKENLLSPANNCDAESAKKSIADTCTLNLESENDCLNNNKHTKNGFINSISNLPLAPMSKSDAESIRVIVSRRKRVNNHNKSHFRLRSSERKSFGFKKSKKLYKSPSKVRSINNDVNRVDRLTNALI